MALLLVFFFSIFHVNAQSSGSTPREFSVVTGPLLPDQIPGMTEIISIGGFRYKPLDWASEFALFNGTGDGVNFNAASVSFRGGIPADGFMTMFYGGFDYYHYQQAGQESFTSSYGAHVGGGMMAFIGDRVWFRSEMKFNFNPGTALFIGFGFSFMLSQP